MDTQALIKGLADAIPLGPHPNPHGEYITVRLDFVQEAVDQLDWLDKGSDEWRTVAYSCRDKLKESQIREKVLQEAMLAVLCDPEGNPCFSGSDGDRKTIADALYYVKTRGENHG
jgi:hypothetical protein